MVSPRNAGSNFEPDTVRASTRRPSWQALAPSTEMMSSDDQALHDWHSDTSLLPPSWGVPLVEDFSWPSHMDDFLNGSGKYDVDPSTHYPGDSNDFISYMSSSDEADTSSSSSHAGSGDFHTSLDYFQHKYSVRTRAALNINLLGFIPRRRLPERTTSAQAPVCTSFSKLTTSRALGR
ncbi:hypothetical protein B0H19DRAFT_1245464 [Mycena capillaripes]|nr:hypothetical protein B0H19DRAFT_1245464 [Mycena capillaripes]